MRYESSSSISISEKSSESCDVSADMVTLRLPNERIVERSCEASRSGRRGARSRTGVARTGRRALSCESSGGRVETESAGMAATSNGARVCARRGDTRGRSKIQANSQVFTCFSRIQKTLGAEMSFQSRTSRNTRKRRELHHSVREKASLMDFENTFPSAGWLERGEREWRGNDGIREMTGFFGVPAARCARRTRRLGLSRGAFPFIRRSATPSPPPETPPARTSA